MTTQQTDWIEYTGSDEQIAEIRHCCNGVLIRLNDYNRIVNDHEFILEACEDLNRGIGWYWIIPDDQLREMKIRQAQTGQPVWCRLKGYERFSPAMYREYWFIGGYSVVRTTKPDWSIPNAEYSLPSWDD